LRRSETVPSHEGKYVYDTEIDNAIVNSLKNTGKVSSGKLKIEAEKKIRRTISPYTYSIHISSLIDQKILEKEDLGRGRYMYYFLTESAEKKLELGLLGKDESEIELFRRIYDIIFFYHIFYYYPEIVFSNADFRDFLTQIGAKENELSWGLVSHGFNRESVEIVYGRKMEFLHMKNIPLEKYKRLCKDYWNERTGQTTVLEDIQLICYPLKNNFEIFIDRFEHWEINKNSSNKLLLTEYHLHLYGFSVDDIVETSGADRNNVSQAINNLEKLKLVKPIIFLDGVPKYRFNDKKLEGLFAAIWDIHSKAEIFLLFKKWCYKEEPTQDEMARLERLVGKEERQRIEVLCGRIRIQTMLAFKRSKTIHQFIKYIDENTNFFWKLLQYPYETPNTFAEYIAYLHDYKNTPYKKEIPIRLRKIFSKYERFQKLVPKELLHHIQAESEQIEEDPFLYSSLELFISNRNKVLTHNTNEVIDFHYYLNYIIDKHLENPGHYEHDIEDLRIQFKDALIKYPFLEDIINDVSPRVFYVPNKVEEQELVYIIEESINNEIKSQEIRDSSEIRNLENHLCHNRIPFSYGEERTYNIVTNRVEDRRSFRELNHDDLCGDKFIIFHTLELVHDPNTQEVRYEPVYHKNDLYQIRNPSRKQVEQFQAKLRSKTRIVVYVVKQKINDKLICREIRDESEIHKFEASLKSGITFHYHVQEIFNPSTQKIEDKKIFYLLNQKEIDSGKFSEVQVIEKVYNPMTRRVEYQPVTHFLEGNKSHTTNGKFKTSRNN
jgi:hypothetical protein